MQEADELCNRIAFIKNGKISLIGDPVHIKESCNHLNLYEATMSIYEIQKLEKNENINNLEIEEIKAPFYTIRFEMKDMEMKHDQLTKYLTNFGEVFKLQKREISLEDAYIHHMKDVG